MAPCTVDEAALEMDLLDYDFHLFTEKGTGTAGVLYRAGPTGYRLAPVAPVPADQLRPLELPVTISPQPTPCLTVEEATERLGLPFLFFIDARPRPRQRAVSPLRRALRVDHPGGLTVV